MRKNYLNIDKVPKFEKILTDIKCHTRAHVLFTCQNVHQFELQQKSTAKILKVHSWSKMQSKNIFKNCKESNQMALEEGVKNFCSKLNFPRSNSSATGSSGEEGS
jgi:hypothetical protein